MSTQEVLKALEHLPKECYPSIIPLLNDQVISALVNRVHHLVQSPNSRCKKHLHALHSLDACYRPKRITKARKLFSQQKGGFFPLILPLIGKAIATGIASAAGGYAVKGIADAITKKK